MEQDNDSDFNQNENCLKHCWNFPPFSPTHPVFDVVFLGREIKIYSPRHFSDGSSAADLDFTLRTTGSNNKDVEK